MNIAFNTKDEAGVAVYKGDKCYYIQAGSSTVVIDDTENTENNDINHKNTKYI